MIFPSLKSMLRWVEMPSIVPVAFFDCTLRCWGAYCRWNGAGQFSEKLQNAGVFFVVGVLCLGLSQLFLAYTEMNATSLCLKVGVSVASVVLNVVVRPWPTHVGHVREFQLLRYLLSTLYVSAGGASLIFNSIKSTTTAVPRGKPELSKRF